MDEYDLSIESLPERLTRQFYEWEKRGRGWQTWNRPVPLEPPFEPFCRYYPQTSSTIDNGRHPTILSSLVEGIKAEFGKLLGKTRQEGTTPASLSWESNADPCPEEFDDDSPLKEIKISIPPNQKISTDQTEQFLLNLSYCTLPLSFEIIGQPDAVSVQLACRQSDLLHVRPQLRAYFPDAVLEENDEFLIQRWNPGINSVIVEFGLSQEFMRPLRSFGSLETDPLIGLIGTLDFLEQDELGLIQILFQAVRQPWPENILKAVLGDDGRGFFSDSPEMVPLARRKVEHPLFAAVIRVVGQSPHRNRAWEIARALGGGLRQFSQPQSNELIPLANDDYDEEVYSDLVLSRLTCRSGMLLNSEELVSLVHPPSISVRSEKLVRHSKKTKQAPAITQGHQLILGENFHQGKSTPVTLSSDQRLRHMYIVGATGTGKSTLLCNLIAQDIQNGLGVGVLDPHGDLIDRVLSFIPKERYEDVILLDPSDAEYPVGLNILSASSELEKNVLSSDLVSVFRRLSTSWGDQMTSVLANAILAVLENEKGGSLFDLRRFLIEPEFRRAFLLTVKDPEVVYYWQKEFPLLAGRPQASLLTRLDIFLRPKLIRHMVIQKDGLNFQEIINGRKIFLAKLAQGLIGEENAYLLGALIVSKLQQAAMARQAKSQEEREAFYLYIDEFQNFITQSMETILSGARKYNFGLILTHQELRQLWSRDSEVASSVVANPGIRACFRLGDFDAQKLESGFASFKADDLQNLGVGEAIVRIERSDYDFNLKVLTPPEISTDTAIRRREEITAISRKKNAKPLKEVEALLTKDNILLLPDVKSPAKETRKEIVRRIQIQREHPIDLEQEKERMAAAASEEKEIRQHTLIQNFIKETGEQNGYRAIIEQKTPDGGRVDVSLEKDENRIACEISVTTTDEHELRNIEKCLNAGYQQVVLCSPDKKTLKKVKALVSKSIPEINRDKVVFFTPNELKQYLEMEAAKDAGKEQRIKGYRVKTSFKAVPDQEKDQKRGSITETLTRSVRRLWEGKQ